MSITFAYTGGSNIQIGGGSNPSPAYSINSEPIRKDMVDLGIKYNITVTGTLIITGALNERETNQRNLVKTIAGVVGEVGTLTIDGPTSLVFTDCIIVSTDANEQDEVSRGIQNQDYTLNFEAYSFTGSTLSKTHLTEISESWETSVDEGTYSDIGGDAYDPQTIFTITQTLSATGRSNRDTQKSGYIAAKEWVQSRIATNPITTVPQDLSKVPESISLDVPAGYSVYNRIVQITQDILEGVYNATTTWQTSLYPATSSIEFSFEGDQTSEAQTVQVNITINGLSSFNLNGGTINKYDNAVSFYNTYIKTNIAAWANSFYTTAGGSKTFNINPVSTSRSDNRTDGTITITQSFNDRIVPFAGASSVSLNITYNNEDGGNKIVAILPIIAKQNGPIIQNMQTTNERKRSISLDVTMDQNSRVNKPTNLALSYIDSYLPNVTIKYRENMTETWNPITGQYTLSLDYVWTDNQPTN